VNGNDKGAGVAERSMGFGLRALNRLAGSDLLDRIRVRKLTERALFQGTKNGFRSATVAGRAFKATQKLTRPARQATGKPRALFDISPDEEQEMFQESVRDFAAAKVRPAAQAADGERKVPEELLAQARKTAAEIAKTGPLGVGCAKDAIGHGLDMAREDGFRYEATLFGVLFATRDQKEGMGAFVAKRKAEFTGK